MAVRSCLGGMLFGSVFVIAGVGVALLIGKQTVLACSRIEPATRQGNCALTTNGFLGSDSRSFLLSELQSASVAEKRDDEGDLLYRIELQTERGTVPMNEVWSSGRRGKQAIASEINTFLQTSNLPELNVDQDDRPMGLLFGGIFSLAGGGIVLGSLVGLVRG
ncbi:MAG: hypothetical protein VKK04_13045 [Synechococcales bacterium]|nr:hypothetical protein [Synechococcales bacterium]